MAVFKIFSNVLNASKMPKNSRIVFKYNTGSFGNGDYAIALKAETGRSEFVEFMRESGFSPEARDEFEVIGYIPSKSDVPVEYSEWDEPKVPELKYYREHDHSFERYSFYDGFAYYFSPLPPNQWVKPRANRREATGAS